MVSFFFTARLTGRRPAQTEGLQRASFRPLLRGGGVSRQEKLGFVALATISRAPIFIAKRSKAKQWHNLTPPSRNFSP